MNVDAICNTILFKDIPSIPEKKNYPFVNCYAMFYSNFWLLLLWKIGDNRSTIVRRVDNFGIYNLKKTR